ncbi:hypothetical protein PN36_18525 [Candidatus Thiomargarita nelsonii]|uniref:Uncharacterized protein n=1 Tax=Candidatus Thiomargarita nelsonii TaxID=1003181 RepID=A0A0A6PEZ9_9GAMM|nr:hypothetical protein PN36_18525 [Candidatus Thiomargarita nelsonii]
MTSENEPFDETAKAFYHHLFKNWGIEVETEREVFSRSRTIDLVVTCSDVDRSKLQNSVFAHFQKLNALELKGVHDPLTVADYNLIVMRANGLGVKKYESQPKSNHQENDTQPTQLLNQITVTIVCVTRPNKILNQLKKELRLVKKEPGIYHCDDVLGKWIIHPSELDLVEKNYPLLPLARGKKLEEFISLCVREGLNDYLQLIIDIGLATDPELIWQKILEVKQMKHQIREETWPVIDQFFREMPEAIGKLPTFQDALAQSTLNNEHRIVLRQLNRKFTQVPKSIVQHIETSSDIDQLDNWLDQIILAKELADIDFNLPQQN